MNGVAARSFGEEVQSTVQYSVLLVDAQSGVTRDRDIVVIQIRRQHVRGDCRGGGHLKAKICASAGGDAYGIASHANGISPSVKENQHRNGGVVATPPVLYVVQLQPENKLSRNVALREKHPEIRLFELVKTAETRWVFRLWGYQGEMEQA